MIIAIDFDGTIHTGKFPQIGDIRDEAYEYIRQLDFDGHYIIINTCRNGDLLLEAINWLLEKDIPFDRVNDNSPENLKQYNSQNTRKIYADVYVDDKQVGGLPEWKQIYDYIKAQEITFKIS